MQITFVALAVRCGSPGGALQKDLAATAQGLLRCLLWCSQQEDPTAMAVVQHLLLEAIPSDLTATAHNKQLAVQLMLVYASNGSGKLASKVRDNASLCSHCAALPVGCTDFRQGRAGSINQCDVSLLLRFGMAVLVQQ